MRRRAASSLERALPLPEVLRGIGPTHIRSNHLMHVYMAYEINPNGQGGVLQHPKHPP